MLPKAILLSAALALAALAGCADSKTTEAEEFGDLGLVATADTGIIRGIVVDEAVTPVVQATVVVDGANLDAVTNENGEFGFDGLLPGSYFLIVSKAGYTTSQQSVVVEANVAQPPIVKILLQRDPTLAPFVDVAKFEGFIECSFSLVIVLFAACGLLPEDVSNNEFLVDYQFGPGVRHVQSEMTWESTQVLGDELQLSYTDFSGPTQNRMNVTAGKSPQIVILDASHVAKFALENGTPATLRVFADDLDETDVVPMDLIQQTYNQSAPQPVRDVLGQECIRWPVLFNACIGAGGVGVVINQEFTVITHSFYHHLPPPAWTFGLDGPPPAP